MDEDNHSIDSPAQSNPGTPLPSNPGTPRNDKNDDIALVSSTSCYPMPQSSSGSSRQQPKPKYSQLLAIIEELGKDIRPTYAGSRSSAERLKRVNWNKMDPKMRNLCSAKFISAKKLEFNADSLEWCPFQDFSQYMTCGTYQLDECETPSDDIQTRNGNITLYFFENALNNMNIKLEKVDIIQTGGVLDLKWCPQLINDKPVLGAACSNGKILLLRICSNNNSIHLQDLTSLNLSLEDKRMILSLDWACQQEGSVMNVASDTKGDLNYIALRESELSLVNRWNAHGFESWIVAFDYSQPHVVYSGGDDCHLKGWDLRNVSSATFIKKRHSMGVTAISKSKLNENWLVTGSYDENVFLWDVRSMKIPVSEISLNGGIWRLKWHPQDSSYLLSASMHNGFHVLSIENGALKEKAHYDKHESLAYGVDWCFQSNKFDNLIGLKDEQSIDTKGTCHSFVASCSFYDKSLHLWKVNI